MKWRGKPSVGGHDSQQGRPDTLAGLWPFGLIEDRLWTDQMAEQHRQCYICDPSVKQRSHGSQTALGIASGLGDGLDLLLVTEMKGPAKLA